MLYSSKQGCYDGYRTRNTDRGYCRRLTPSLYCALDLMKNPRRGKYYEVLQPYWYAGWEVFAHHRGAYPVATWLTEEAALKLLASLEKMMESQAPYQQNTEKKICRT